MLTASPITVTEAPASGQHCLGPDSLQDRGTLRGTDRGSDSVSGSESLRPRLWTLLGNGGPADSWTSQPSRSATRDFHLPDGHGSRPQLAAEPGLPVPGIGLQDHELD